MRGWPLFILWFLLLFAGPAGAAPDEEDEPEAMAVYEFMDDALSGELTVGGAQDVRHFRDRVRDGEIPHPNVFTPEGLFSEHDLPLGKSRKCRVLICPRGEATEARLLAQPEVRWIGQLGFSTKLGGKGFKRQPLHLVAVVDKSGSMTDVLPLVRKSLRTVARQLHHDDQISIVTYGDRGQLVLPPTKVSAKGRADILATIDTIDVGGSTAMEDGLSVGIRVARRSRRSFAGTTRVMLFTDERPNVGATDKQSFMSLLEGASADGIGMTTIGVGVQFGAELATAISSVRGGNLFFFPDESTMTTVFEDELDMMVTEVAHDLKLSVQPDAGLKIAGVYGIPGEKLQWGKDGAIELEVATLFLSKRAGGIYVALAPDGSRMLPTTRPTVGSALVHVEMSYTPVGDERRTAKTALRTVAPADASIGLSRGVLLVDQVTALKEATRLHHEDNDQEGAYQLVHALAGRFRRLTDDDLEPERTLVLDLEETLAKRSGHAGEGAPSHALDPVSGLPKKIAGDE